jgi:hypothetical protein
MLFRTFHQPAEQHKGKSSVDVSHLFSGVIGVASLSAHCDLKELTVAANEIVSYMFVCFA